MKKTFQFLATGSLVAFFVLIWAGGAVWSARALGVELDYSPRVFGALAFVYATWFFGSVATMLLCIGVAQPSKSAQNLAAISEAVRLAKEEALIAHDKETGSTKGEFNSAMRRAQEKRKS